jgi:hypothetical protein
MVLWVIGSRFALSEAGLRSLQDGYLDFRPSNPGTAVTLPRFRIGFIMAFVAIAALNFAAARTVFSHTGLTNELLAVGAAPMVNVLGIGLLVGRARPDSQPFLWGFTAFGAIALAIYVVLASCIPDETIGPYLRTVVKPLAGIVGTDRAVPIMQIAYYSVAVVALALPQFALAMLSGLFTSRHKATVGRR